MRLPTVMVHHPSGGAMLINEADFDPSIHKKFNGEPEAPKAAKPAAPTPQPAAKAPEPQELSQAQDIVPSAFVTPPDKMTDDELADAIEKRDGDRPHGNTSRVKLLAMYRGD